MADVCFGSIKARVARLTRLDACGIPVIGSASTVVTDGFVSINPEPQYDDGEDYSLKNAWGDWCVNEKDDPRLKEVTLSVEFCKVDPDAIEIATGARVILSGTDGYGLAFDETAGSRWALETWSRVPGSTACAGGQVQYVYWVFPNIGPGKFGGFTLENATATFSVEALTAGAPNSTTWVAGATPATTGDPYPQSYMPANEEILVGEHFAFNVTTVAPPAASCGAVALA